MKICENGIIREMTAEEIAEMEEAQARAEAYEKHRPYSADEVTAMLIAAQINALDVDDATAVRMVAFYPEWETDTAYTSANGKPIGYKVQRNGRLWKLRQEHTSMSGWEPGATGTESLWEEICEVHDGTKYDPIPYDGNMTLVKDKYYSQGGVVYLCTRDTGNAVYNALSELVGIYVDVVEV